MVAVSAVSAYPMPSEDTLPANVASWTPAPDRAVLLIHDMQRYFVRPFPEHQSPREDMVDNIAALRQHCVAHGIPIAYTAQPGDMSPGERGLLRDFWGPGMRASTWDRGIVAELEPSEADWLLTKWRYSAFFRSDLLGRLREHGRDQLIVCGVYAHVGVLMTGVEAFTNDVETFFVADAVADFTLEGHRLAMEYAASTCAVVTTTGRVISQLAGTVVGGYAPATAATGEAA